MKMHHTGKQPHTLGKVIKAVVSMAAAWLLVACDAALVQSPDGSGSAALASRDVIAILDSNAPKNRIIAAANAGGYRLSDTTPLPAFDKVLLTFQTPPTVSGPEAITYLETAEPAASVGVNHAYRIQTDVARNDPRNYAQTLMEWPPQGCSAQMPIGLIDTGIDTASSALGNARVISRQFGRGGRDTEQHGTDVASVLAHPARLKDLTIYSASVMSRTPDGELIAGADALIRALEWMASQDVRVVNMSLAGPFNKILKITVDEAAARGLILVASVGNSGSDAGPFYPAAYDPVIAATAVDADSRIYRRAVRGAFVDVAAPGVDIFVPSDRGGRFVTGTSFAAAFVTARIAADSRMVATASPNDVRGLLANASDDLGPRGIDRTFGAGLLKGPARCD